MAWVIANVLRKLATQALAATTLDDRLSAEAGMRPMSGSLGNVLYGLVIRDTQIRVLLGEDPPGRPEIVARADDAVERFLTLTERR